MARGGPEKRRRRGACARPPGDESPNRRFHANVVSPTPAPEAEKIAVRKPLPSFNGAMATERATWLRTYMEEATRLMRCNRHGALHVCAWHGHEAAGLRSPTREWSDAHVAAADATLPTIERATALVAGARAGQPDGSGCWATHYAREQSHTAPTKQNQLAMWKEADDATKQKFARVLFF